jgi:hypothetical protein
MTGFRVLSLAVFRLMFDTIKDQLPNAAEKLTHLRRFL